MRSWLWRLSSWSPSSDASYLSHGAPTKIFCIRWFISSPHKFPTWDGHNPLFLGRCCQLADYGSFLPQVLFPLLYSVLVWLLPCCLFVLGVKKVNSFYQQDWSIHYSRHFQRSPFFLLPWILVSCVLGMVAEMYLFWAAGRPEFRDAHCSLGPFHRGYLGNLWKK